VQDLQNKVKKVHPFVILWWFSWENKLKHTKAF
jgi:hypothetical protein